MNHSGPQIAVAASDMRSYYDCCHGEQLTFTTGQVSFEVQARAFGCVLATPNTTLGEDISLSALLAQMHALTAGAKLNSFAKTWTPLRQTMVSIPPTKPHAQAPPSMVTIPEISNYTFVAVGVEIEGQSSDPMERPNPSDSYGAEGVDVQVSLCSYIAMPLTKTEFCRSHSHSGSLCAVSVGGCPRTTLQGHDGYSENLLA